MVPPRRARQVAFWFVIMAFAATALAAEGGAAPATASAEHSFGWLSLVPPVVAIAMAMVTGRVVASLLFGVLAGALILARGNVLAALGATSETFLWPSLADSEHLRVFVFTSLMGAMVGVMHASGGMHGLVERLIVWARDRRRGQLTCLMLGLIIFFDDYANTLLLGGTLRPLTDRLNISREKLAYLVDSTAAPVAGLAVVSTWVAGEVGYIASGLAQLDPPLDSSAFEIFVATIPYRFYVLWALVLVGLVAWMQRDFGPMLAAERRAVAGKPRGDHAGELPGEWPEPEPSVPRRWELAVVPVVVCVATVAWLMWWTGNRALPVGEPREMLAVLGACDSYLALVYGSLAGLVSAALLASGRHAISNWQIQRAAGLGAQAMLPALAILWIAWSLADVTGEDHLRTGEYLATLVQGRVTPAWMPTAVFVLSAATAFSTGTSWGTMGILLPLVIPVTGRVLSAAGLAVDAHSPILLASVGGVLAGSIFGDHCSPISDTTVLSSRASGCDHIAHVRTQMPYALLVALLSIVCGTLPAGFGVSPWISLIFGTLVLAAAVRVMGKPVSSQAVSVAK